MKRQKEGRERGDEEIKGFLRKDYKDSSRNEVIRIGPQSNRSGVLVKRRGDTPGMCTQRKGHAST